MESISRPILVSKQVISPGRESITIALLNIVLNQFLMTYPYTHRLVHLSVFLRDGNKNPHWSMCRKEYFLVVSKS